jgi:hypothetical protein
MNEEGSSFGVTPKNKPAKLYFTRKCTTKESLTSGMALPFTLKSILRQKNNYGNSNLSPCKNILIFQKSSERNQNPSRYYNSIITNLKFRNKPKYHLSKILI